MKLLTLWQDKKARKRWIRYWLAHPFWGMLNYITHYALRYVPIKVNAAIGSTLGEIAGTKRFVKTHQKVLRNLSLLRPDLDEKAKEQLAVQMWRNIGQSMTEYSLSDKLHKQALVSIENYDQHLLPLIEQKQAIIFVFAHTGNWESHGNYVREKGIDLMCLYKPVENRFSMRIAQNARARMGGVMKLVDASQPNAMRLVCKHLAAKGALWIAIDEEKNKQVLCPRFGRAISLDNSNLAYVVRLARRYRTAIVPLWTRREGLKQITFIDKPLFVADNDEAVQAVELQLEAALENWIKQHLEQWYMLHELRL
ncbi:MAG: hypothetical protein WAX77_07170 [Methylococcaceae bacterium]